MAAFNTSSSMRRTLLVGYLSVFLALGVCGGWAALASINGAVIAGATIVVESYSKKVQHKEGGIVSRIMVKDGDRVTEGQDLVVLDPTDAKAELGITVTMLDELLVKKARLEAQRDGTSGIALPPNLTARSGEAQLTQIIAGQARLLSSTLESVDSKAKQLHQQIGQLKEQISGLDAQLSSNKNQTALIAEELGSLKKLQSSGLVPNSRVLAVEREAAQLEGQFGELLSKKASANSQIGEVELRLLQLDEDLRTEVLTELRDTESKIAELNERRVSLSSRLARTSIKSPITGTIYQLAIHTEGGVIGAGETLMLIVPEGDDLVLQAMVLPNDIDQVAVGQQAQIRFPAFNARLTPEIFGEVQQVAADTTRANENSPPSYAVRIIISAKEIKKLGDNRLKPGMTAEAFIQTSARSPLSYLLKPLTDQFAHAMRET
jgi:HlyD family secretion protein